ncbi:hypothetical protein [Nonomuraea roseoviolacea]|uniref:Ig-like domain-containing protein n=1 Tax=Nonomuraea roseoviolacea subsp. carminata TaxID=160689 RepID=A0ABT1K596_9ACTN|nr:hypothetical protein [Nonomuraea roseoviolacea]MCP2349185.1 hypothetical protein [Nonomuraea roseoviolacea subsp. carminata]
MENARDGIAGFRLTEHTWITEVGNWIDAISPDGRRAGALLFDPRVVGLPGVRDRVVAAVMTDQRLVLGGLGGLIPVADVVAAGEQVWLLTAQAVSPTLADLLGSASADPTGGTAAHGAAPGGPAWTPYGTGSVDPGGAASVLLETAQTLLALHASGVTHGSLHPGTVVIAADGGALLSERGLSDAIRGQVSPPARDAESWAALARGLAASTRDAPAAAQLFERAAATATTHGLAAARDALLAGRGALPGGTISRERLAQAARGRSAFAQAPPRALPYPPEPVDEGDIVTLLHVPGRSPAPHGGPAQGAAPMRFGPGVDVDTHQQRTETPAERIWREGREEPTVHGARAVRASRARRRRTVLAAALFAVIIAGAILAWLRLGGGGPDLAVASVDVAAPKKTQGCDSAVVVTGTIVTNGGAGEIQYEWRKNLDKEVVKQTLRTTSDRTSYQVPLRWTLKGKSTVKATATLRILSPGPVRSDKASFTYKC